MRARAIFTPTRTVEPLPASAEPASYGGVARAASPASGRRGASEAGPIAAIATDAADRLERTAAAASRPNAAELARLSELLGKEIPEAYAFAERCRETITFFGGARVGREDPIFARGVRWGEAVTLMNFGALAGADSLRRATEPGAFSAEAARAATGAILAADAGASGAAAIALQARTGGRETLERILFANTTTGAGPGMMEAVPLGVRTTRKQLEKAFRELKQPLRDVARTQGSRIRLPFEQETNTLIEQVEFFSSFLARRLALTEHAAGFVVFPGGFGTLNELFEVMRGGRPLVFDQSAFWGRPVDALFSAWRARGFVSSERLDRSAVVDGPEAGLRHLRAAAAEEKPLHPTIEAGLRMADDAKAALAKLASLPPAVTFIGSRKLDPKDREVAVAGRLAEALARRNIPVRIGGDGVLFDATLAGVRRGDASAAVQALLLDEGQLDPEAIAKRCDVSAIVHSAPVHKLALYEDTDAIVALPGGLGTFDEVFEVATLMQTKKIEKRPLILVGKEFWQPILDAFERAMRGGGQQLIGPDDMKLFQVVDTEDDALAIVEAHRRDATRSSAS